VGEALESVRMGEYAARRPNELLGGAATTRGARACARHPAALLLLDEPLSNLDASSGSKHAHGDPSRVQGIKLTTVT